MSVFSRLKTPKNASVPSEVYPWLARDMPELNEATLTPLQYTFMHKWSLGDFTTDEVTQVTDLGQLTVPEQAEALDRAALEQGTGAAFHPGIESWSILHSPHIYSQKFRARAEIEPGRLSQGNALPWQADYYACAEEWWPSQRPVKVRRLDDNNELTDPQDWMPRWGMGGTVESWYKLGFVVEQDDGNFIETERQL